MRSNTKEKIKKVAFSLFASNGYEATTMNQIAAGVGIKKPAIYTYFNGKEELFLSIYEELEKDYRSYMEKVLDTARNIEEIEQKLYYIFEQYILYFAQSKKVSAFWNRILFFPPASLKDKLYLKIFSNENYFKEEFKKIFQQGMNQGVIRKAPVEVMLLSYYSIREGFLLFSTLLNEKLKEQKIKFAWQDYWMGIKKR
ncbi:AcrR family transcriptional regulator [Desulfohalotomaculum tongense]|uniref:TetR/AcrR family transcriptional regulator n=1 Tax=Desulforadius tongensis TaxID=1216062 RepID=UPI00195EFD46|nr:TetR/AcrR family transcriptional regulator [Desulforadius tongensis]MBM7856088.1 AcrR family transcriptional regulator [Desulforadius tongensis]